ncbi:MAG: AAA family ATPase [Labilithrix sp.]|nr:AAA family ATPase [Labilithrix sp.]MCW5831531.1 AAA family ATPase [Labilithrix sp.]
MILGFGSFELDDELYELRSAGEVVPIQKKSLDLLFHLVRARGKVVTRDELLKAVWPGVVVSEQALSQAILGVRRALADDGAEPLVLKTVRGRGYRIVPPVRAVAGEEGAREERHRAPRHPHVGRAGALATLEDAARSALDGRGRIALVRGEAGIGKTRLVEELEARLPGTRFVRGHAFSGEGAPPLWPWIQVGRRLGLESDPLDDDLGSARGRFRAGDVILRRVLGSALEAPLVLVLEDLQWADAASLDLVKLLAQELHAARVLVVLTARVERGRKGGALARLPELVTIELQRLGRAEIAALVAAVIGRAPSEPVVDRVLEKTGGTPSLFVQIAPVLAARDLDAPGTSALLGVSSVKEAVAEQVAHLSAELQETLALASVFGNTFALGPLAMSAGTSEAALVDRLDAAVEQGVVSRGDAPRTYRFTQPLVRDALYRTLLDGEKAKLHARVGRALVEYWGDEARARADDIAHHLTLAAPVGSPAEAADYLALALEDAARRGDPAAVARWTRLADELVAHARPAEAAQLRARLPRR